MVKLLAMGYLALLLASCASDRAVSAPMQSCQDIYQEFQLQQEATTLCGKSRCTYTYGDVKHSVDTQHKLFDCYKEKKLPNE